MQPQKFSPYHNVVNDDSKSVLKSYILLLKDFTQLSHFTVYLSFLNALFKHPVPPQFDVLEQLQKFSGFIAEWIF